MLSIRTVAFWVQPIQNTTGLHELHDSTTTWPKVLVEFASFASVALVVCAADLFGRKKTLASLSIPFAFCYTSLITGSRSAAIAHIVTFFASSMEGASTLLALIYIGEIAEPSVRGRLLCYNMLIHLFGRSCFQVGRLYLDEFTLQIVCVTLAIVSVLLFLIRNPETPTYLLRKNRDYEAKFVFIRLKGGECDVSREVTDTLGALYGKFKRALLVIIALSTLSKFLSYGIFWSFRVYPLDVSSLDTESAWYRVFEHLYPLLLVLLCSLLVDTVGRRIVLFLGVGAITVTMSAVGAFHFTTEKGFDATGLDLAPVLALTLYSGLNTFSLLPVVDILMAELLPSKAKGILLSIAYLVPFALTIALVKGFECLEENFSPSKKFWTFAAVAFLGVVFVYFMVPETKRKTLKQIQHDWTKRAPGKGRGPKSRPEEEAMF